MNLLLDTHTFIWWDSNASHLSQKAQALIGDPSNSIYLSLVSIWEIQIKRNLGKLQIRKPIQDILTEQRANGVNTLQIEIKHLIELDNLPNHHKDPFDRLLIAQAASEGLTLLTKDKFFQDYQVSVIWD